MTTLLLPILLIVGACGVGFGLLVKRTERPDGWGEANTPHRGGSATTRVPRERARTRSEQPRPYDFQRDSWLETWREIRRLPEVSER